MDFNHPLYKEIFFAVYNDLPRGGPGDFNSTKKAYTLMQGLSSRPLILDVGCGPGKQTMDLAKISAGQIVAIDRHQPFLDRLSAAVHTANLDQRVMVQKADMFDLPFPKEHFDVIWSEGAIYNMGFEQGIRSLGTFLKDGGFFAVTEAVWLRSDPPDDLRENWTQEYPAMTDIETNKQTITRLGYTLVGHFTLPNSAWLEDFYTPMEKRIFDVAEQYQGNSEAQKIIAHLKKEIVLFNTYAEYYGYEFYIFRKA